MLRKKHIKYKQKAFTLIELLIVITIIAIIIAASIPSIAKSNRNQSQTEFTNTLITLIHAQRNRAMRFNMTTYIDFTRDEKIIPSMSPKNTCSTIETHLLHRILNQKNEPLELSRNTSAHYHLPENIDFKIFIENTELSPPFRLCFQPSGLAYFYHQTTEIFPNAQNKFNIRIGQTYAPNRYASAFVHLYVTKLGKTRIIKTRVPSI